MNLTKAINYLNKVQNEIPQLTNNPKLVLKIFNKEDVKNMDYVDINNLLLRFTYEDLYLYDFILKYINQINEFENFNLNISGGEISLTPKILYNSDIIKLKYSSNATCISFNIFKGTYINESTRLLNELKEYRDKKIEYQPYYIRDFKYEFDNIIEWRRNYCEHLKTYLENKNFLNKIKFAHEINKYGLKNAYNDKVTYTGFWKEFLTTNKKLELLYKNNLLEVTKSDENRKTHYLNSLNTQNWVKENYNMIEQNIKDILSFLKKEGFNE